MLIEKALKFSFGNQIMASRLLGLNRNTLHTKIKKFNIDVWRFKK
ncbi:MAG: helix-turn-helix domain-containing protein [Candidatus Omnitrophota bacterium]